MPHVSLGWEGGGLQPPTPKTNAAAQNGFKLFSLCPSDKDQLPMITKEFQLLIFKTHHSNVS